MKKTMAYMLSTVLLLGNLIACDGSSITPHDTHPAETSDTTAEVTATETSDESETDASTSPAVYTAVEQLAEDKAVTTVQAVVHTELESMDMSQLPENYAAALMGVRDRIQTYEVLYRVDGCTVAAFISVPKDYTESTRPLLIYNRGGNGNFGASSALEIAMMAQLTDCVVIASQYRETKPGTGKDEFGGADVADVTFWMDRVQEMGFVDAEKIYMVGVSRGGMQTCLALQADKDHAIRAAACISGVYDLAANFESREDMREMLTRRVGGTPTTAPEAYAARSAVTFAADLQTPLLLIHSKGDQQVDYSQATAFAEKLEQAGKSYHFITRETASHGLETIDEWKTIMDWLAQQ